MSERKSLRKLRMMKLGTKNWYLEKQKLKSCHVPAVRGGAAPCFQVYLRASNSAFERQRFRAKIRRGGRAVECTGLENQQGLAPFVGSNPTPSAKTKRPAVSGFFGFWRGCWFEATLGSTKSSGTILNANGGRNAARAMDGGA